MDFSLIICTYMRPKPLLKLLQSIRKSTLYPSEILIIDGSVNQETQQLIDANNFKNLTYFKVSEKNRGLTKQRNFGIAQVSTSMEIVCFLDDDTVVTSTYFEKLIETYALFPDAIGVGGYITNEVHWEVLKKDEKVTTRQFAYDGWVRRDGSRFVLRKKLGLDANRPPAHMPAFSHGRSVSFLPPSGNIYQVEQFMGGVASYRYSVFKTHKFSEYFEGYGLYEDADFTLRLSKNGKLYVNTAAQLAHYHEASGRPNMFAYGKMVVRNGWYVWRVAYAKPSIKARFKWNAICLLLATIRFTNTFTTTNKKEALMESLGRFIGWCSLLFNKPKLQ